MYCPEAGIFDDRLLFKVLKMLEMLEDEGIEIGLSVSN